MTDAEKAKKLAELRASRPGGYQEPQAKSMLPSHASDAFICPHCNAYAHQRWTRAAAIIPIENGFEWGEPVGEHYYSHCQKCHDPSFWVGERLIYPPASTAPMPADDMPADVKADYMEARDVFEKSPRSAGGLLLFGLLNYIVEQMITRPKHVQGLFGKLPADKLAGIENRDKKK